MPAVAFHTAVPLPPTESPSSSSSSCRSHSAPATLPGTRGPAANPNRCRPPATLYAGTSRSTATGRPWYASNGEPCTAAAAKWAHPSVHAHSSVNGQSIRNGPVQAALLPLLSPLPPAPRSPASTWCAYSCAIDTGTASAPCREPLACTELTVIAPDTGSYDEAAGEEGSHRTSALGAAWPNSAASRPCASATASAIHIARRNSWPSGTVTLKPATGLDRLAAVAACSSYVRFAASATLARGPSALSTMRRSTLVSGSDGSSVSMLIPKNPDASVGAQAPRGSDGPPRFTRGASVRLSSATSYMQASAPGWPLRMPSAPRECSVPYTYDDSGANGGAGACRAEAPEAPEAPEAWPAASAPYAAATFSR